MVDMRMEALAEQQHGVVSLEQGRALGLTKAAIRHRYESGRWEIVFPGVYRLSGSLRTARQQAMASVLAAGPDAALSHTSGSALLALPGYVLKPIVVTVPRRRRSIPGVRLEQSLALPLHHRVVVDGIPCTSVARTLFDLCGDVHPRRAERTLDTALSRRRVTIPALWRVLDELAVQGRAGVVLLRSLLTERGGRYVPPESELEARFVELITAAGLPQPSRQVDVGNADLWIGRVDFAWRGARLVVEVDGAAFHDGWLDRHADAQRTADLRSAGWTVLRFRWRDVVDTPERVAAQIRRSFRGASALR